MPDDTIAAFQEQRQVLCQTTPLPHSRSRGRFCVRPHHCHIPGADRLCARRHHCHTPGAETGSVLDDIIAAFQEPRQVLCQTTPLPHSRSRQVMCQTTPLPHSRSRDRFCARLHHCHIPGAQTGSVPDDTTATFQEQRQVLCQTTPLPHSWSRDRFCAIPHYCHIPGAETEKVQMGLE